MGRKIPGKKHKTIKDPFKQREKRFESLRLKVDNPPKNPDIQEIPRNLLKIIEFKRKAEEPVTKKSKRKRKGSTLLSVAKFLDKEPSEKGMIKPDVFIPNLVQKPGESVEAFIKRINLMTQGMINEVEFEKKFGVEIKKNVKTGEVTEVKGLNNKNKTSKKKKLSEKRKEKLNTKNLSLKGVKDFNQLQDVVEFGEVVHKPPDLSKVKKEYCGIKKFSNLLLNDLVKNTQSKVKNSQSNIEKEKIEIERKFLVESYRKLKKKNKNI